MSQSVIQMDAYQRYIHLSRYSRFRDDLGRREDWTETVDRLVSFWLDEGRLPSKARSKIADTVNTDVRHAVLNLEAMPSMRTMMTAGKALERDNAAGFNCSYLPIESLRDFDELLYILMCGTGVGYSVESKYIKQLPTVAEDMYETDTTIVVPDSKIGWAKSFRELLALLWSGQIPKWDLSKLRPAGTRLKTFGGRSSGPDPLDELFRFCVAKTKAASGRRMSSLEVHDIVCKIADIVVVGGVRRSALICLCDLNDDMMRHAKSGNWWEENPQRALANISAVYDQKPMFDVFLDEWKSLHESKSGERGIFSRFASQQQAKRNGRREWDWDFGTNPCSEIILRPHQFCNLSEVIGRIGDPKQNLLRKAKVATILGTLQSTLTDFRYLRSQWKRNTEEERLLGVSLTGICDSELLASGNAQTLSDMRDFVIDTNREYAQILGIPQSAATTCVKPSGTVSQLVNSSSGIHARFSEYYIRTARSDKKDPLSDFLIEQGFPHEPDVMKPNSQWVFSFPIKSPDGCLTNSSLTTEDSLKMWEQYQEHWCEHKPSITLYYDKHNFLSLGQYVYSNIDKISGISFMPLTDHIYKQAPYQKISQEEYEDFVGKMPSEVNWDDLASFDNGTDNTEGVQQLACVGGACEL